MSARYRIYIGDTTPAQVAALVHGHFLAATITTGLGIWEDVEEEVTIVEVVEIAAESETSTRDAFQARVTAFALVARDRFGQDCVLVTRDAPDAWLI